LRILIDGWLADGYSPRLNASRFWVIFTALLCGGPCLFLLGWTSTLGQARLAAMAVGFFAGFVTGNQAAAIFDVVPAWLRASAIGVLNLVAALVSGFAPFLGGLARNTIGVDRLMSYTAAAYILTGLLLLYGILKHFERDKIND
jgi:MFS family permease